MDLIQSENDYALKSSVNQLKGKVYEKIKEFGLLILTIPIPELDIPVAIAAIVSVLIIHTPKSILKINTKKSVLKKKLK